MICQSSAVLASMVVKEARVGFASSCELMHPPLLGTCYPVPSARVPTRRRSPLWPLGPSGPLRPILDGEDVAGRILEPCDPETARAVDVALAAEARQIVVTLEAHALLFQLLRRALHVIQLPQRGGP